MEKIIHPLMSLTASGTVGDQLQFRQYRDILKPLISGQPLFHLLFRRGLMRECFNKETLYLPSKIKFI